MRKSTENAIKTLLRIDTTVTREERMAVIAAMLNARGKGPDPTKDMSVANAADYLNMSRTTLWRMCKDGRVECDRRGKKFYIKATAIAELKREEHQVH